MKTYFEYLVDEYGKKEAVRILERQPSYVFDRKTMLSIKKYHPRTAVLKHLSQAQKNPR